MSSFHLQIVTPDGLFYDGQAESVSVRASTGDLTILPKHMDFVTALGMGAATVTIDGRKRKAACIGGMLAVSSGDVRIIATTFEWQENIDLERAQLALDTARKTLEHRDSLSQDEIRLAEAKLRRALVRTGLHS